MAAPQVSGRGRAADAAPPRLDGRRRSSRRSSRPATRCATTAATRSRCSARAAAWSTSCAPTTRCSSRRRRSVSFPVNGGTVPVDLDRRRRRRPAPGRSRRRSRRRMPGVTVIGLDTASRFPAGSTVTANVAARRGERRRHRLRDPHPGRPDAPDPVLGRGRPPAARGRSRRTALTHPGIYEATTVGGERKVLRYRYPTKGDGDVPGARGRLPRARHEADRELRRRRPLRARAVPHVVFAGDENHLVGFTGLPTDLNPYLETFGEARPVAGVVLPAPGTYEIVFDTRSARRAGPFTFRYWMNDTTPPRLHVLSTSGAEDHRLDHRRRRRRRSGLDPAPRSTATASSSATSHGRLDDPRRPRPAPADRHRVRLPGAEEHGGRRADQAEHRDAPPHRHGAVAPANGAASCA